MDMDSPRRSLRASDRATGIQEAFKHTRRARLTDSSQFHAMGNRLMRGLTQ
jgi:hypothetical protein